MISKNVVIITRDELQEIEQRAFQRGVERGKFEARAEPNERIAKNCRHWKDGCCEICGAPWQSFEIGSAHKCDHFEPRAT